MRVIPPFPLAQPRMSFRLVIKRGFKMRALSVCLALELLSTASAQVNNWINTNSARWDASANWSLGALPASNQSVNILNAGYKAVNVDSGTLSNHSSSMTVSSLAVGAPANALSTLLLNYFGQNTPLKVLNSCTIQTNGTILNLGSSFEVAGDASHRWTIAGGTYTQEGGLTVINPTIEFQNGTINATNATMNLGTLIMGDNFALTPGNFYQSGGTVLSAGLRNDLGTYTLMDNGTLYALDRTILYSPSSHFEHMGGTNYGDVQVRAGFYKLHDGLLHGNDLSSTGDPSGDEGFFQYGGTAEFATIEAQGPESGATYPYISYSLQAGTLDCGNLSILGNGSFQEVGGIMTLTNGLDLEHGVFNLYDGSLSMPSLVVSNRGAFQIYGGTNHVAGDVELFDTGFLIGGGGLSSVNFGVGDGAQLTQIRGLNDISGVLSITGNYSMSGGVLSVGGMYLRGAISISFSPGLTAPLFIATGWINFGGTMNISASQNSMGQLGLATNGTINLAASPLVVRFANSTSLTWDANSLLTIAGWNGSYDGGGSNQIYFGTTSGGLTSSQLSRVRFLNPTGIPAGTYNARILSTGEVVPIPPPTLQAMRIGSALVLTWPSGFQLLSATNVTGPYTPVTGATSPRTNALNKPREFFRLQT
jgi:hypothetical protein